MSVSFVSRSWSTSWTRSRYEWKVRSSPRSTSATSSSPVVCLRRSSLSPPEKAMLSQTNTRSPAITPSAKAWSLA